MSIVYGALGAVLVILLFLGGVYLGWRLRGARDEVKQPAPVKPSTPEKEEREQLIEDQKAFKTLMNWNLDMVYGNDAVTDKEARISAGVPKEG